MNRNAFRYKPGEADETSLDIWSLLAIVRRNLFGIVISILICLEGAALLVLYLPKTFKSATVLDIHSSYFRNPLVSDLISETTSPDELRSQRASLVRLALSDEFIDSMGENLGLFRSDPESKQRRQERKGLVDRIEHFSLSPTSFQVTAIGDTPREALRISQAVLDQLIVTILRARYTILEQARNAIQAQVQFLGRTLQDLGRVRDAQKLETRIEEVNQRIAELRSKFTEFHPKLVELERTAAGLRGQLRGLPEGPSIFDENDSAKAFTLSNSEEPIQEIYQDLLRKLSHLNIVLAMEGNRETPMHLSVVQKPDFPLKPLFPDPVKFLAFGLGAGFLLALLQTVYFEARRRERFGAEDAADWLGMPHLGSLPMLPAGRRILQLEGPDRRALPGPTERPASES